MAPPSAPLSFDLEDRAREKRESREEDEHALASGQVSREELGRRNSFARAGRLRIDFARALPLK